MPPFLGHCSVTIKKKSKEKKKEGRDKDEVYACWGVGLSVYDVDGHSCKLAQDAVKPYGMSLDLAWTLYRHFPGTAKLVSGFISSL